jgi:hypothetical protein
MTTTEAAYSKIGKEASNKTSRKGSQASSAMMSPGGGSFHNTKGIDISSHRSPFKLNNK